MELVMAPGERKVRLLGGEVGGKTKLLDGGRAKAQSRGKSDLALFSDFDEAYIRALPTSPSISSERLLLYIRHLSPATWLHFAAFG